MSKIPHPIPYQGSKRQLATQILHYFPGQVTRLIEPFAGSGALSLAAAQHHKAQKFLLNDLNTALIELWQTIVFQPDALANRYKTLWYMQQGCERQFYDRVRQRFNHNHRPYYFLYLLARCVKAAVRYNASGEFNQSPDNRRKGRHPDTMRQDILGTSELLKGRVTFRNNDYREILHQATGDDVVYMDPPYQGVGAKHDPRYIAGVDYACFIEALADLNTRNIAYLVSYDGQTGNRKHGQQLPASLELTHIRLQAGRSSQATLLGLSEQTIESLYISPALMERLSPAATTTEPVQLSLFGEPV